MCINTIQRLSGFFQLFVLLSLLIWTADPEVAVAMTTESSRHSSESSGELCICLIIYVNKTTVLQQCVRPICDTYKTAKIPSITSRAVDTIRTTYLSTPCYKIVVFYIY